MIEIRLPPLIKRHICEVAVIGILLNKDHILPADSLDYFPRDGRLPGARPTADADYHVFILTVDPNDDTLKQFFENLRNSRTCFHHVFMLDELAAHDFREIRDS
jgi:hypothetical protein